METKRQTLADIDKKEPFKVPEDYFYQFNQLIMANLPERNVATHRKVTLWQKTKPWVYMAAMFLGLFFTIKTLISLPSANNTADTTTPKYNNWSDVRISEEEFFDYVETQFVDENYYDLVYNQVYLNSL
ncbi:MAG: hypothetical protein ACOH2V_04365 [Candidatus Saccharimonadaceae bacterium]